MQTEPDLLTVAEVCARSSAYTLHIVAAALAGMQATLPTVGRHATEGFLAHYPVHGELQPCAAVGAAGRADGVGNSETIKALIADTGLQPNQFVFVDIYMLRSRHSNNKYHKVWLAETKRRFTLLEYDLSDVRAGTGRLPHCDLI